MNFNTRQKKVINATEPKILCLAAAASGKALPDTTLIPTPNGLRMVGDIQIGDYLFNKSGNPTKVLGVYPQGKRYVYEITFGDGRKALCSKDHIWYVRYGKEKDFKEYTVEQMLEKGILDVNDESAWFIPKESGTNYPERKFSISPFEYGENLKDCISDEYKYCSKEQRMLLIAGLCVNEGLAPEVKEIEITFVGQSKLIEDIKEVFGSLGYTSRMELIEFTKKTFIFKLTVNLLSKDEKEVPIISITELDYKTDMTCFFVDNPEHLFLTNDFLITHNTRVLTERIRSLIEDKKVEPSEIVAITLTNLAANEMRKRLGSIANEMFIGTIHSYAAKICRENDIEIQELIDTEQFDRILKKVLLINRERYPKVSHLLIDECQDLDSLTYQFIGRIPTENVFYVGDDRQIIYAFRGASEKDLINIYDNAEFKKYNLTDNYRNAPAIVNFANSLIASSTTLSPNSNPVKTKTGTVERCSFSEALDELEQNQKWGSWFILCRTNEQIQSVLEILEQKEIPCITFKKGDLDSDELIKVMGSEKVKVLTIHTSKGLENKNVIVVGARVYDEEERKISYVAATRAENSLYWCPALPKKKKKKEVKRATNNRIIEF